LLDLRQAWISTFQNLFTTVQGWLAVENTPPSLERGNMDFDGSSLHIRDLHFQYQSAQSNTLNDINLDIKMGEMVAFVGHSGSGKSTILRTQPKRILYLPQRRPSPMISLKIWRKNTAQAAAKKVHPFPADKSSASPLRGL